MPHCAVAAGVAVPESALTAYGKQLVWSKTAIIETPFGIISPVRTWNQVRSSYLYYVVEMIS